MVYKDWLHVHAKESTRVSARHALLIDDYHVSEFAFFTFFFHDCSHDDQHLLESLEATDEMWCRDSVGLHDTFEPEYIHAALTSDTPLGELIFGRSEWERLGGLPGIEDPLTTFFRKHGARSTTPCYYCQLS